jgi:condensin complex subunit 1
MALVEVIGSLIRELATSPDLTADASQSQRQLNGLYDLLLERTLDVSSYVRTKVLSVLARLCDLPVKFPRQRLAVTRVGVDSLEDKAAGVRKAAVILLVRLIVTHPYGLMHGGLLRLQEWEERYQKVKEELGKVEGVVGKAVEREGSEDEAESDAETDTDQDEGQESNLVGESLARTPMETPRR